MCRIAVFSGGLDKSWLATTLDQLENSMGGDGNGFYCPYENKIFRGTAVEVDDIATIGAERGGAFHTRFASVGGVKSELNHPFPLRDKGHGVLIHNGTWREYDGWDVSDKVKSDTATAAELVSEFGLGCLLSSYFDGSGVWVNARPGGEVIIVKRSGNLGMAKLGKTALNGTDKGWMLVSERPKTGATEYKTLDNKVYMIEPSGRWGLCEGLDKILLSPDRNPSRNFVSSFSGMGFSNYNRAKAPLNDDGFGYDDDSPLGVRGVCELCGCFDITNYEPLPTADPGVRTVKRVCADCKTWGEDWLQGYYRTSNPQLPVAQETEQEEPTSDELDAITDDWLKKHDPYEEYSTQTIID